MTKFEEVHTIGSFSFEPAAGILKDAAGRVVALRPQTAKVLEVLSCRHGDLVTKDDLMREVWADTHVTDDSLVQCISEIRKVLGPIDSAHLKTVPRQGYKLDLAGRGAPLKLSSSRRSVAILGAGAIAAALLAFVLFAIGWWALVHDSSSLGAHRTEFAQPRKPSIAVLPFETLSDDRSQEYFSDGITSDLITDLSKLSGLFVVSGNATFAYKNGSGEISEIADELGVRFILKGTVRKSGDRLRINTQLIDTTSGRHIWSERYDRYLRDVFELQDEVVLSIVTALSIRLEPGELHGLRRDLTSSVKAYDLYLRGRKEFARRTHEGNQNARLLFQKAVDLDPGFARGYAYLAFAYVRAFRGGWSSNSEEMLEKSRDLIKKAVELNNTSPLSYFVMGFLDLYGKQHEKSIIAIQKALELSPNYAHAYALLGLTLTMAGRPEAALEPLKKAIQLSPHMPLEYYGVLGKTYFVMERYERAVEFFKRALSSNPTSENDLMWLAATYARLGQIEAAEWQAQELLALYPNFSLGQIFKVLPFKDPTHTERLIDSLKKAGLGN